jgi:hypothetical protein
VIVVDDTLLLAVLAGTTPFSTLGSVAGDVASTGSWYWRLTRAVLDDRSGGSLTQAFNRLPGDDQQRVRAGLRLLPAEIGLLSFRRLVPVMAALDSGRRLNLLTAEAVASSLLLDADIAVTTRSPLLDDACERLGIQVHLIA